MNDRTVTAASTRLWTQVLGIVGVGLFLTACAPATRPPESAAAPAATVPTTTTSALLLPYSDETQTVPDADFDVDLRILYVCALHIADAVQAPKFGFNDDSLSADDRGILAEVADCFTTGPLAGRSLALVGRADPRGEEEYNIELGARRAASVATYVEALGVPEGSIAITSRGKLDAVGTNEAGWARDRRVDLLLR